MPMIRFRKKSSAWNRIASAIVVNNNKRTGICNATMNIRDDVISKGSKNKIFVFMIRCSGQWNMLIKVSDDTTHRHHVSALLLDLFCFQYLAYERFVQPKLNQIFCAHFDDVRNSVDRFIDRFHYIVNCVRKTHRACQTLSVEICKLVWGHALPFLSWRISLNKFVIVLPAGQQ